MADKEKTAAERRAQYAADRKKADKESLDQWRKDKRSEDRINDMTRGRILYNPGPMTVEGVTTLARGNSESVLVSSDTTGVSESVIFRPAKPKNGEAAATMRNYMNHNMDEAGNDIYEPSTRKVQKLIEVRPFTYGDTSQKAGQTVMTPVFSDIPKADTDIPNAKAATDTSPAQYGAIVAGYMRLIDDGPDGARLTIGMRDQNGNVPNYGASVFFDVPKSVENENFNVRAVLNELREGSRGEAPKGVYAQITCMMDATAIERPRPVQRENESQEDFDARAQRWEKSHENREKFNIQSRENFGITEVKSMRTMFNWDAVKDRQSDRDAQAAKADQRQSQSQGMHQ